MNTETLTPFCAEHMAFLRPLPEEAVARRRKLQAWFVVVLPRLERWTRARLVGSSAVDRTEAHGWAMEELLLKVLGGAFEAPPSGGGSEQGYVRTTWHRLLDTWWRREAGWRARRPGMSRLERVRLPGDQRETRGSRVRRWAAQRDTALHWEMAVRRPPTPEELMLASAEVPGSRWTLADLPLPPVERLVWGLRFEPERVGPPDVDVALAASRPGVGWGVLAHRDALVPALEGWLHRRLLGRARHRRPTASEWRDLALLFRAVDSADGAAVARALAWLDQRVSRARRKLATLDPRPAAKPGRASDRNQLSGGGAQRSPASQRVPTRAPTGGVR